MVADHWFMQIENILEAMQITSDTARIRLAAFQLEGDSCHGRVSRIKKICFLCSSYCRSQATAA